MSIKFQVENRFTGAVQFTAEIYCGEGEAMGVKPQPRVPQRRDSGADLLVERLNFVNGRNLSGANLSGQWIIQGATRSDGYAFFLQKLTGDAEPMVKAGCRRFTLREAQAHWEKTRAGTALLTETRIIVRCMVDIAHARGLMKHDAAVVSKAA